MTWIISDNSKHASMIITNHTAAAIDLMFTMKYTASNMHVISTSSKNVINLPHLLGLVNKKWFIRIMYYIHTKRQVCHNNGTINCWNWSGSEISNLLHLLRLLLNTTAFNTAKKHQFLSVLVLMLHSQLVTTVFSDRFIALILLAWWHNNDSLPPSLVFMTTKKYL